MHCVRNFKTVASSIRLPVLLYFWGSACVGYMHYTPVKLY